MGIPAAAKALSSSAPRHICVSGAEKMDEYIQPWLYASTDGDVAHFFPCVALNGQSIGAA